MKILRRLYGYLRAYRAWAFVAFGSMIIFALTQTVLAALVQPVIDDVLTPPGVHRVVKVNERMSAVNRALAEHAPALARARRGFDHWWNADPTQKWKRVLTVML